MNLSEYTVEVCQPNRTVSRLMVDVLEEVGARTRAAMKSEGEPAADLLLFDVSARADAHAKARLEEHEREEKPVVFVGLRHLRGGAEEGAWLDRPFSASAMLHQCALALDVTLTIPPSALEGAMTLDTSEEPIRRMIEREGPPTREIDYEEASQLEAEFGLEPGVLGAGLDATPSESVEELEIDDDSDLIVDVVEADELDDSLILGGRIVGEIAAQVLELGAVPDAYLDDSPAPAELRSEGLFSTSPDLPGEVPSPADRTLDELDLRRVPEPASQVLVDAETSLELKNFSRMLAEAWGKVGLSARVEDRSDRLNRVLHALFEGGLDGAAQALQRVPQSEGFSGSLRALGVVGLFRTLRDRKLRGRLEVSTTEQAYVLYIDGGVLCDIDALAGDPEQLLLQILREHGAIDEVVYRNLSMEEGAPVEMRLRMEGLVSEAALEQALRLRAREIFKQVCRARFGTFSFIEIFRGDSHAWPVRELRMSIDQALLEILREASFETEDSEATSRTKLMADATRMASIDMGSLTRTERELLSVFRRGETLGEARERLGREVEEVDSVVNRLKRAQLLRRDGDSSAPKSHPPASLAERSDPTRAVAAPLAPLELERPADRDESTAITGPDDPINHVIEEEAGHHATVRQGYVHPPIGGDTEEDEPTVSSRSRDVGVAPTFDLERLLEEVSEELSSDGDG
jgi:hypothetical protein